MLVPILAIRALLKDRVALICNVAVIAGVVVPLLLLFGVRNGVYDALIGRLLSNPATLQIDTAGNHDFSHRDLEELRSWPETGFATLKTRSLFDYVNVRSLKARQVREAILQPSGTGDPTLPEGAELSLSTIAISAALADQLQLQIGDEALLVTQASERPRQLALPVTVTGIVPAGRASGRAVLADIAVLDLVEAFYDEYALPEHGITQGRPLSERVPTFEGMRAYARNIDALIPLQARIEARFGIRTEARSREVASIKGLGRNLSLALALVAIVAAIGLAATLIFGFWGEVVRQRRMMATLALLGLPNQLIALFPIVQAAVISVLGLIVSFLLFTVFSGVAERLFATGLSEYGRLVSLSFAEAVAVSLAVIVFVLASSLFAARRALLVDPAIVLREQA